MAVELGVESSGARRPRRDGGLVGGRSIDTGGWGTHGLPPVGVAGPGITLIARCLRRSGVDAVPATGAGERR